MRVFADIQNYVRHIHSEHSILRGKVEVENAKNAAQTRKCAYLVAFLLREENQLGGYNIDYQCIDSRFITFCIGK